MPYCPLSCVWLYTSCSQLLGVVGLSDCCLVSSMLMLCWVCSGQTGLHVSCFLQFSPSCLLPSLV